MSAGDQDVETFVCYRCEGRFSSGESLVVPWAVAGGTPAGELLDLDHGDLVDVCDECMDWITELLNRPNVATVKDRLETIARESKNLRELLDRERGDVADLAGIFAAACRIAERHGIELDLDASLPDEEGST